MDWLINLFTQQNSVAHIVLLFSIVIAVGVLLGKIKICGISLGVTFVLFAGIIAGHVGFTAPVDILTFIQDFGLILFVFMIGLQVGPGFFESFKKGGVTLNLLSTAAVLLNIGVMFACCYLFFDTPDVNNLPMMVGTLYGAVTNTPGLGAANEALTSVFPADKVPSIASGYACAYPLGVLGIIGATIAIRYICKIRLEDENEQLQALENENPHEKPFSMHLKVSNSYLAGKKLQQISEFLNRDIVCSRLLHNGEVVIPNKNTILDLDDEMNIVCAEHDAEAIRAFIGPAIDNPFPEDNEKQPLVSKRIVITNPSMNGKTLGIGKHALMRIGDAAVENIVLSNTQGQNVPAISGQVTAISTTESMQMRLPNPNPFSDAVTIPFVVGKAGTHNVQLRFTNLAGLTVDTYTATLPFGEHTYTWHAASMPAGVYFVTLYVDGKKIQNNKLIHIQ